MVCECLMLPEVTSHVLSLILIAIVTFLVTIFGTFFTSGLSLCVVGSYSRDMSIGHFDRSLSSYFNVFLLSVYLSRVVDPFSGVP